VLSVAGPTIWNSLIEDVCGIRRVPIYSPRNLAMYPLDEIDDLGAPMSEDCIC